MPQISESIIINAPVEKVWEFVTDPANGQKFIPGIIEQINISPKSTKVGQKWDWHANLVGVEFRGKSEATEMDYLKKWAVKTWGDADSFRTYVFESSGEGTKLTIEVERTAIKSTLAQLAAVIIEGIHRINIQQSLKKLKEILEAQQ